MIIKPIDFPPYTKAEIKRLDSDGSVLCDLYGDEISPQGERYHDTDISLPDGVELFSLTAEEVAEISPQHAPGQ